MEKPACQLLARLLDILVNHEPDIPIVVFNYLMDVAKYIKQECERERATENPNIDSLLS